MTTHSADWTGTLQIIEEPGRGWRITAPPALPAPLAAAAGLRRPIGRRAVWQSKLHRTQPDAEQALTAARRTITEATPPGGAGEH